MPDEKFEEKELEKREEKNRRDPLSSVVWAAIFIWAGLALLADNLGFLDNLNVDAWAIVTLGSGAIVLLEIAFRLLVPAYRQPLLGSLIFAVFLLGIGLEILTGVSMTWALILIAVGAYIILRGVFRDRGEG